MQTRSKIQLILEETERKYMIYRNLSYLTEKYNIVDNIFASKGNSICEVTKGYFVPVKEGKLYDLVMEMNPTQAIRIKGGEFTLGNLREQMTEFDDINSVVEIKPA